MRHCNKLGDHDVVCIGFGPSNVALAIAFEETAPHLKVAFLEAQSGFGWHTGMLFDHARMQVSYLKDLVTFRNPQSRFSFVNFLHAKGRLAAFSNLGAFTPTRQEFHQYLEWCADQFTDQVFYGHRVTSIDAPNADGMAVIRAQTASGRTEVRARSVVHATGLRGRLPETIAAGPRILHAHGILHHLKSHPAQPGSRFAVVGGGQSAAETVRYLLDTVPDSRVSAVVSRFGYTPADDSPFVNEIFDPEHVDTFYFAEDAGRRDILRRHAATNYAAVDTPLIEELYRVTYDQRVSGRTRLVFNRCEMIVSAHHDGSAVQARFRNLLTGETRTEEFDWLICATGFRPTCPSELLAGPLLEGHRRAAQTSAQTAALLTRAYRLDFDDPALPDLYSVHTSEDSHGLTATLNSNMAIRAGEIVADILERRDARARPGPVAEPDAKTPCREVSRVS